MSIKRTSSVPLRRMLLRLSMVAGIVATLGAFPAVGMAAKGGGGGGGGEVTSIANNLSFPTIWSDGITLPAPYTQYAPGTVETFAAGALTPLGTVPVGTLDPTKLTSSVPDPADPTRTLYPQGVAEPSDPAISANIWQAENAFAASPNPVNVSQVDWGDNLEGTSVANMLGKPIRVETTLLENLTPPLTMTGYNMYHVSGAQDTEVFGTDGTTYNSSVADVYSGCARLTIQRLDISRDDPYVSSITWDPTTGEWTGDGLIAPPIFNGGVWAGGEGSGYSAEINGSGSVVYGYNWQTSGLSAGDYRLTFSLDPLCPAATLNTFITPDTTILPPAEGETISPAAESGGGGTGSAAVAQIDGINNLSYIDVELGNPSYQPYVPPKPENTVLPVISGKAQQGQVLSVDNGEWKTVPTSYAYQWRSCDAAGDACTDIAGATSSTYTLTSADVGHTLRAAVTATNANGDTEAVSLPTSQVLPLAPTNMGLPMILGVPQEGHTLYATNGSWDNATSFAYQWQVSDGAGWSDIAGANAGSFLLTEAVVGHTMRLVVTAHNAGGDTSATSAATSVVAAHQASSQRTQARLTLQLRWMTKTQLHVWGFVYPPHNGKQLMVQQRTRAGWKTVARVRLQKATAQRSRYAITLAKATPGFYRVYLAGDKAHVPSASSQVRARALARVTLQLRQLTRDRLQLFGAMFPARNGRNVMLQQRTHSGWMTITRARLRFATRTHSHYSVILAHPKHGTYRARYGGDSAYRPSNSAWMTLR